MSGELVEKLRHRAIAFLRETKRFLEEGEYDLACFSAEQALQLYLKSVFLKLFGETLRVHGVRELLGLLASRLYQEGFREEAIKVKDFVRENRYTLSVIEDAYIDARYTIRGFTEEEAREALEVSLKLIKLLEEIEKHVWMG